MMALCAFSHAANATTLTTTVGLTGGATVTITQDDADFVTLPATSVSPETSQTTGTVYFNTLGSVIDVYRSPFENAGSEYGGVPGGNGGYQQPGFDTLPYTSIEGGGSATYTYAPSNSLSILWGSPDSWNTLSFYSGPDGTGTDLYNITGSSLLIQFDGHDQVEFAFTGVTFDSVVLSSSTNAFEFANLATPLPATLPLLLGGLGILGLFARRTKRKNASVRPAH